MKLIVTLVAALFAMSVFAAESSNAPAKSSKVAVHKEKKSKKSKKSKEKKPADTSAPATGAEQPK